MNMHVPVGAGLKPAPTPPRVLIADDLPDVREALRLLLKPEGFAVATAASPEEALLAVEASRFDAVLIDLNYTRDTTSGAEGLDLLARLQVLAPSLPVVVMTAWGSIDLAVQAMRRGAVDFVTKPWQNEQIVATLTACCNGHRTGAARQALPPEQNDLRVARSVQQRLLPQRTPRLASLSCAARCEESGAVGGDFYDFLDLAPSQIGLVIADVCGRGVPAAIIMAHLSAALRSLAPEMPRDLAELTRTLNALLLTATAAQHYVTLFAAVYDDARHTLLYANCGHVPPVVLRGSGQVEWLEPTSPVLGLIETFDSRPQETALRAGDTLVAYTDGLTETRNRADEELGADRLLASLRAHAGLDAPQLVEELLRARRAFAATDERDDVTVLVAQGR
jgi:phosphoserine phosphatase RsbU/P